MFGGSASYLMAQVVNEKSFFKVMITPENFVKRRLVSGPIWLIVDSVSFPGNGWPDFPVVILGFWLTNLQSVVVGSSQNCECPFMDGPFQFEVRVVGLNEWTLNLVERTANRKKFVLTATVDASVVLSQIVNAAQAVVNLCRKRDWADDDLITLEGLIPQLKGLARLH